MLPSSMPGNPSATQRQATRTPIAGHFQYGEAECASCFRIIHSARFPCQSASCRKCCPSGRHTSPLDSLVESTRGVKTRDRGEVRRIRRTSSDHRLALGEPLGCRRLASRAVKRRRREVSWCFPQDETERPEGTQKLTESGVSAGCTRWPSNRNRTELIALPWRSQKAVMSLSSFVLRLILKNTSLLLSVTLMLRCSAAPAGAASLGALGAPFSPLSDMSVWGVTLVVLVRVLGSVSA